jgi:hypothetical protein
VLIDSQKEYAKPVGAKIFDVHAVEREILYFENIKVTCI